MRVAVYARVSGDEQKETGTIEVQLHATRQWCAERGYEIAEVFKDEGISGAVPLADRPGGAALLAAAEKQRARKERDFEAVVVYAMDRLGRDALVALLAIERLKQLKVPAEFVREEFDDTPAGKFQQTVMAAVSELERSLITQRMSGGRYRAVRDGGKYLSATTPFGYRRDPTLDERGRPVGRLLIDEDEAAEGDSPGHEGTAKWVRKMFELCIDGMGLKQIADFLDAAGVPAPMANHPSPKRRARFGGWSFSTVAKVLNAARYTGSATYRNEPMTCPAIVTPEVFAAAKAALKRRQFDALRNAKNEYIFRNLLYCRCCGGKYQGRTKREAQGMVTLFQCGTRRSAGPKAGHVGFPWIVREDDIGPRIKEAVDAFLADPREAVRAWDAIIERERTDVAGADDRIVELEKKLAGLPAQEARVADAFRRGILSGALFEDQLAAIKAERREAEAELAKTRALSGDAEVEAATLQWARDAVAAGLIKTVAGKVFDEEKEEWVSTDEMTPSEWRRRIETVIREVWVEADGSLTIIGPGDVVVCRSSR